MTPQTVEACTGGDLAGFEKRGNSENFLHPNTSPLKFQLIEIIRPAVLAAITCMVRGVR